MSVTTPPTRPFPTFPTRPHLTHGCPPPSSDGSPLDEVFQGDSPAPKREPGSPRWQICHRGASRRCDTVQGVTPVNSVYHGLDREFLIDLSWELLSHDDIREHDSPNMDSPYGYQEIV